MPLILNGDGAIAGLTAGGLPDASITQSELAANIAGNGPAFSAYASGSQSFTTTTKIVFDTEEFDTNNNFSSSRFTPTVAGYYLISSTFSPNATNLRANISIYKNGSEYKRSNDFATSGLLFAVGIVSLVYLNGSTDYVEIYGYTSSSATSYAGSAYTWVNGFLVKAA
jgi:hypothetical protein